MTEKKRPFRDLLDVLVDLKGVTLEFIAESWKRGSRRVWDQSIRSAHFYDTYQTLESTYYLSGANSNGTARRVSGLILLEALDSCAFFLRDPSGRYFSEEFAVGFVWD